MTWQQNQNTSVPWHDIDSMDAASAEYLKKISAMPRARLPGVLARRHLWFIILLPLAAGVFCVREAWIGLLPGSLYNYAVVEAFWLAAGLLCVLSA